jgi:excinuclease ABC subunit C
VELALKNAEHLLLERRTMSEKRDFIPRAVTALQEHLHVDVPPLVIEAFDISHLSGTDTVASMVCFKDGKPFKSGYRMFKIKTVTGIDDFAAIGEAVGRRYTRLLKEIEEKSQPVEEIESNQAEENANPESEDSEDSDDDRISAEAGRLPDLILIDGGLGQLNRARSVLESLALNDLPVIGLAKRLEEIYIPGESEPLQLSKSSSALKLLQQIRDEAHRFAITRQRMLRGKRQVKSRLDDIEGIGPNRRVALLKQFGSLKRITEASIEQIASVPGISKPLAGKIKAVLTGREGA